MDTFRSFVDQFDNIRDVVCNDLQNQHNDGQLNFDHYGSFDNILGGIRYCFNCIKWSILDSLVRASATTFTAESAVLQFLEPRLTELGLFARQAANHATGTSILNVIMLNCQRWTNDCLNLITASA